MASLNRDAGYDAGDRLLGRIDDALRRALPAGGSLERLENGRFALWMDGLSLPRAASEVERLRRLGGSVTVDGQTGAMARSLSAGLTEIRSGERRRRLLLHADAALADAKRLGGGRLWQSPGTQPRTALLPQEEVSRAISTGELHYEVQPIVRLHDRGPAGVEALLRWTRGDGSVVGLDVFVDQIDRLPVAAAARLGAMAAESVAPVFDTPDTFVSFNVSGALFDDCGGRSAAWFDALLAAVPPDRLVLELVESAILVSPTRTIETIERFRAKGVRIALDDFGTGLSNLDRLLTYPVDVLKIDRSLVAGLGRDARSDAVVGALATLARDLGIETVVEGIETEAQHAAVRDLGLTYGQGWLYGRPGPATDREALAGEDRTRTRTWQGGRTA